MHNGPRKRVRQTSVRQPDAAADNQNRENREAGATRNKAAPAPRKRTPHTRSWIVVFSLCICVLSSAI